ncbi:NUDIX hydrolase [Yoonia vestfoldensis]|jgi:ADP-ribose pyrophosphatase YjhB (NUDIX family)|uniref:NUDIX hydrolase n=1 Tax=Yoonia vestfoldensis TaxID=245188 RepID=UPI0003620039|nr:NUDIX hydrolase [Yoonia vestfoldensis]
MEKAASTALPRLGAIAVVLHQDKVLLVQRKNPPDAGLWGFPGGHVEPGETALAAAARELFEETGVQARPVRYLTNLDIILRDQGGALQFHFLLAAVLCDYVRGTPIAAYDVSDAGWIAVSNVPSLPTSADVDRIIALAYSTTPTIGPI